MARRNGYSDRNDESGRYDYSESPSSGQSGQYYDYDDGYASDSSPYDASPYSGRSSYNRQQRQSPYGQSAYGNGQQSAYSQSAYSQQQSYNQQPAYGQSAYASQQSAYGQRSNVSGRAQQPTAYPVGAGRTYESSRAGQGAAAGTGAATSSNGGYYGATGMNGYPTDVYESHNHHHPNPAMNGVNIGMNAGAYAGFSGGQGGNSGKPKSVSRRVFLGLAGAAAAVLVGAAGIGWYTHRAVACTVNGEPREAPIGSSAQEIVSRGYASPKAGNLVSICAEGETPEVLVQGGGSPYTLTVNGEAVDVDSYRLQENDVLEFANGSDVTEEVTVQTTEYPCGLQYPDDYLYLVTVGYVSQWGRNGVSTVETGTVSGKVIDRGVTTEAQDLIISTSGINPADGRMLVALTFDDGPSTTYTPQILDILAAYGAKATFFNIGTNIEGTGDEGLAIMQRVVAEGHQLASHTYSHNDPGLTSMDLDTRNWEISHTFELIANATGVATEVMRPPFGELRGKGFVQYLASGGDIAYSAYWSVDSEDWTLPGSDQIIANCTNNINGENYNGAVILMHDGGGDRSQGVAALPGIIETFQAYGYQLVTMNELLAADPTFPEWVYSGYVTRPEWAVIPDAANYL